MLQLSLWVATLVTSNLVPVVSLLGVVGNALNVAVFFRQGLRERVKRLPLQPGAGRPGRLHALLPHLRGGGGGAVPSLSPLATSSLHSSVHVRHDQAQR